MGAKACICVETPQINATTKTTSTKITPDNIIYLPNATPSTYTPSTPSLPQSHKTYTNTVKQYQNNDEDLQLAMALSLNSQYTPPTSNTNNITMLYGFDGIILFEESSLLIDGYIRQIKNNLIKQHIIPLELHQLCLNYFYIPTSMSKLNELRNTAEILLDSYKVFQIEKLMFNKVCSTTYTNNNLEMCNLILNNWKLNEKTETFREYIYECSQRCLIKDNSNILKIILQNIIYDSKYEEWDMIRMKEIMALINKAAKYNAFKCIQLLLENPDKLDWSNELVNPTVLLNSIKYQYKRLKLIHFIMDRLENIKIRFICGDIMEDIITYDLVEIAKRIINNRWHTLNENDVKYAKFVNLKCYKWIMKRENAFDYYKCDVDSGVKLDEWDD